VAWLTTLAIVDAYDIAAFPAKLPAVQVDDDGTTLAQMGRGAVAITVQAPSSGTSVQVVTTHLKSKLLTFPGGRFQPHDEDERARFATDALDRRAAEAATLRSWVSAALANAGQSHALILTGDLNDTEQGGDHPNTARPARLRAAHAGLRPARSGRCSTAVEPGAADARGQELLAHQPGPQRTDRPHSRLCGRGAAADLDHRARRNRPAPSLHHDQPERAPRHTQF
jgi:hypothetical protein